MTLLTVSDADRRRRKAELAEFKADIAMIRERFQNIKQEDMQLSFQLHHMHEQEDREHAGLISGRGIRAYEPPTIRKMYDSVTQPTPSTTPSSPELHGSKAPAPTSPSNAENQQPASSVTSASSGAGSSAGAFSLIQDLLSGQRLFSEVLPWSRSNPPADAANSGDALLKQAGLDGFTLLSPNAQSQNQSPAVAQSPQKESTASQASSVGLLPLGNEGSGSEIVSSPQRSSALSPPAASADTTGGSPPSVPRLSRVRRPTHRASAVSVSSPASSTSALRTPSSAQAARPPSPSRVVSLSENSPSCVGQGVSPSSSATPSIGAQQTPLRALTPAQQLRAELAERRSGVAAKLFSDAAKEALLVRAGLLPGPADAGAIRARSSEEGAGAGVGDSAGAIRATLAERVAQSASAGSAGATPGKIEEGWQSESVAESLRLSGELRSRLRAALGERECAKSGRGGGGGGQLCGRLLLLLVVAQGLYILKLKFSPRSDAQRQSAATAAQSQSNGHDLTKLFSASGAVNAQRDVDADSIHLGGPRTYEASRGAAGYGSHERKWVRKFAGGGINANDDSEPGEETRKGVEFRSGDDDWMVDGTKTTRPLIVDEESAGRGGSGGEEAERKGVEFRSGDDDWMVDGTQTTRPLIVDEERGGTGGGGGEEAERKGMELRSGDDDWMVDGTQSGQEVIVDEDTWREADDVAFGRDFEKQPITVMAYEVRPSPTTHGKQLITVMAYEIRKYPCDVPCELVGKRRPSQLDASLAGGVPRHKAVLRSMEPRGYYKSNDPAWAHRDHAVVMTVHYDSDVPVQYGSWEEYHVMRPPVNKTASALAAAFISNCHANNFRLEAVKELSRHMEVHSYGRCLNNMPYETDKLPVLAQHLFSFAFENTCEGDYVTEKYWQCLVAGSIPVVIGAPNIANFAPSPNSYLEIKSLEDVPRVAQQMVTLAGNQTAYDEMLAWKKDGPSQAFIANMDLSAVHSSCRLCIFLADRIRRKDLDAAKTRRPCRCEAPGKREGEKLVVYHLYVRERGTFHFTSVFLRSDHLTLRGLTLAIRRSFQKKTHRPVWVGKRPASLGGDEKAWALKIYRIYPAGSTQREALWGEAWFRNLSQVVAHVTAHPCARLEVIFV
ncbi:unnamed protein product [Closterium sp. NIES-65]|nr:unnamed protein product [Closterium sp. NIES-65]